MLLQFDNQAAFAIGAASYIYQPVSDHENAPRILLRIVLADRETLAFVDTGGVNFICSPLIAEMLGLGAEDRLDSMRLLFRGAFYFGHTYRVPLQFVAEKGRSLTVEVTAFVPQLPPNVEWPDDFPCILGMSGCLERLRFAIDPESDTFYFGPLGEM